MGYEKKKKLKINPTAPGIEGKNPSDCQRIQILRTTWSQNEIGLRLQFQRNTQVRDHNTIR